MNPSPDSPAAPIGLADQIQALSAHVVGLSGRRHRAAGVVWRDGIVVTSASFLWRASSVSVVLPDGETLSGELRGADGPTDLAVVAITGSSASVLPAARPAEPRVGDFVYAVGRDPSGMVEASFGHVGAVAGAWRTWRGGRIDRLIRLDGGLYPGLNGAPVADAQGRVLGIASQAFSRHHGVVVPVSTIERVLDQLLAHGRVLHGYLGVAVQPAQTSLEGRTQAGLLVTSLASEGPAQAGGLLVGDVIVELDGQPVQSLEALRDRLTIGATARVKVSRGGQPHELSLQVAQRPGSRCH